MTLTINVKEGITKMIMQKYQYYFSLEMSKKKSDLGYPWKKSGTNMGWVP